MVGGPKPISRTGYHHPPAKQGRQNHHHHVRTCVLTFFTQHHHHHHLPASQGGRGGWQADRQRGCRVAHWAHLGAKQVLKYLLSLVDNIDVKKC